MPTNTHTLLEVHVSHFSTLLIHEHSHSLSSLLITLAMLKHKGFSLDYHPYLTISQDFKASNNLIGSRGISSSIHQPENLVKESEDDQFVHILAWGCKSRLRFQSDVSDGPLRNESGGNAGVATLFD